MYNVQNNLRLPFSEQTRLIWPFQMRLTGLVVLPFAGDFEGVDVEAKVPRHRLQHQHWEGSVRVVVVHQRVDLSRVQPITGHVALGVEQRPQHFPCRQMGDKRGVECLRMRETA